jgi:ribonuclease P protein component
LEKKYRIKKNTEIQHLLKIKKTVGNKYFVIFYTENHENNNFRYAIGVSKKYGNAVARNLVKRRIREVIKVNNFIDRCDFFIIVKIETKNLKFNKIKEYLEQLFENAKILRK